MWISHQELAKGPAHQRVNELLEEKKLAASHGMHNGDELGGSLWPLNSIKSICTTGWKSTATAGSSPTMISDQDFEHRPSDLRRIHVFCMSDSFLPDTSQLLGRFTED